MSVRKVELTLAANDADALEKIKRVDTGIDKLREAAKAKAVILGLDDKQATYKIAAFNRSLDKLAIRNANPRITVDGVDRDELSLLRLDAALDKIGAKKVSPTVDVDTKSAESNVTALTGSLGGLSGVAMPALIASAVATSGVLITAGLGLGAFGLAAIGAVAPIMKASKATGGLSANLNKLNPDQQAAAKSLLSLGDSYHKFEKALAPQVLTAFNDAMKIGKNLLGDFEPVAKASGVALDGVLKSVGNNFQSGEWQQFFGFLKTNAGPDIKQIGGLFTDLLNVIPPVTEALHPLGTGILYVTDQVVQDTAKIATLVGGIEHLGSAAVTLGHQTSGNNSPFRFLDNSHLLNGIKFVNDLLPRMLQHAAEGAAGTKLPMDGLFQSTRKVASATIQAATAAASETTALNAQKAALETTLGTLNSYVDATITQASDLHSLKQALQASGDRIGYNTDKQRASFSAAQQYIENTTKTADSALAAHRGIDAQISTIRKALPILENVKGKTAAYRAELQTLKSILDKLRAERNIDKYVNIHVNQSGTLVGGPGGSFINGGGGGHLLADGGPVRGPGTGTSDSIPSRLSNGEYVIRASAVKAVGMGLLASINSAGSGTPKRGDGYHFASGGFSIPAPSPAAVAASGSTEQTVRVVLEAGNDEVIKALVKAFRYEIANNAGGDVQRHLGRSR